MPDATALIPADAVLSWPAIPEEPSTVLDDVSIHDVLTLARSQGAVRFSRSFIPSPTDEPRVDITGRTLALYGGDIELHRYPTGTTLPSNPNWADNALTFIGAGTAYLVGVRLTGGGHGLRVADGARVCLIDCTLEGQALDSVSRYSSGEQVGIYGCRIEGTGKGYPLTEEGESDGKASRAHSLYARGPAPSEVLDTTFIDAQGWAVQAKNLNGTGWQDLCRMRRCEVRNCYGTMYGFQHVTLEVEDITQIGGTRTTVLRAYRGFVHVRRELMADELESPVPTVAHFQTGARSTEPWPQQGPAVTLAVPEGVDAVDCRYGLNMTPSTGVDGDTIVPVDVPGLLIVQNSELINTVRLDDEPGPVMETKTYILDPIPAEQSEADAWNMPVALDTATIDEGFWTAPTQVFVQANGVTIGVADPTNPSQIGGDFRTWASSGETEVQTSEMISELSLTLTGTDLPDPPPPPDPGEDSEILVALEELKTDLQAVSAEVGQLQSDLTSVRSDLAAARSEIAGISGQIASLSDQITTLSGQIDVLLNREYRLVPVDP